VAQPKLLLICATRVAQAEFESATLLGRTLRRLSTDGRLEVRVAADNREGLPSVYNRQICDENRAKTLLFIHDDVWLDDCFVYERLAEALDRFDIVGIAGNVRREPMQPAWNFVTEQPFTWDAPANLSGVVAHGRGPGGDICRYGPAGQACRLLDGVFLAARCKVLLQAGLRFDERFTFDFYDLDFCRSAEAAGLRMGTWPIAVTHDSSGKFGSTDWQAALGAYRKKWGD
jgi:hypothetical protein